MAEILPFRKPKAAAKHHGKTLCRRGFHRWTVDRAQSFDVKQGKLVTVFRCERCGATKHQLL
ncbi:hypothetical protein [Candidatus Methylocalor cossyra]|uniref:ABC transporter permease n=1 Tax=Candidatus Methylocalor cossyra TaxID=3108543 RepID=A0ABM9NGS1_9GAMM